MVLFNNLKNFNKILIKKLEIIANIINKGQFIYNNRNFNL